MSRLQATAPAAPASRPHGPDLPPESMARGHGALLTVIPPARAGGPRLAIVGYLLPPDPLPGADRAAAAVAAPSAPPAGDLLIDRDQYRATVSGRDLGLVHQEFELLAYLAAHPNRAFTRGEILAGAWPDWATLAGRTVDIHIHRLRRKLGPRYAPCLVTIRRVGYMFSPPGPS
jgi:hypothetical protein